MKTSLYGIELRILRSAIVGGLLLWASAALAFHFYLEFRWIQAVAGGFLAALLHYFGEVWHQIGHASAARRTGFPMRAVALGWFLGTSIYPAAEPELPARVHIRRALGGLPFSLALGAAAGLIFVLLSPEDGLAYWLAGFVCLENLLVFGLGALLPLGFTDGSTLMKYWGQR